MTSLLDQILWWLGVAFAVVLAVPAAFLLGELVLSLAAAVSWCGWAWALARTHGEPPTGWSLVRVFFRRWRDMWGYRKGRVFFSGPGGYWRGIGDWEVTPRQSGGGK